MTQGSCFHGCHHELAVLLGKTAQLVLSPTQSADDVAVWMANYGSGILNSENQGVHD